LIKEEVGFLVGGEEEEEEDVDLEMGRRTPVRRARDSIRFLCCCGGGTVKGRGGKSHLRWPGPLSGNRISVLYGVITG
jgi:hypothetical protein